MNADEKKYPRIGEDILLSCDFEGGDPELDPLDYVGQLKQVEVGKWREFHLDLSGNLVRVSAAVLGVKVLMIIGFDAIGQANKISISVEETTQKDPLEHPQRELSFNFGRRAS